MNAVNGTGKTANVQIVEMVSQEDFTLKQFVIALRYIKVWSSSCLFFTFYSLCM
jgi:hypothetical protein